jgi:hypothetical protein
VSLEDEPQPQAPPLVLVRGSATAEEVAALVAVLQGLSAAAATAEEDASATVSEWGAPHRLVRRSYPHGPGGWRSSGLPR